MNIKSCLSRVLKRKNTPSPHLVFPERSDLLLKKRVALKRAFVFGFAFVTFVSLCDFNQELLGTDVLGDGLGALEDGVLGQLPRK